MRCDQTGTVRSILEEISQACGAATLHRVRRVVAQDGAHLLERESFRAMTAREEHEEAMHNATRDSGYVDGVDDLEVKLLTVNVDGLGAYALSPAERMEEILTTALASLPDVIMLQEVVLEMYKVLQQRLQG